MPFSGSSFGLWNDVDLTSAFSGTLSVVNKTDLSDNPQDFVLYLGSPTSGTLLQAQSNPGVDNIVITPTDISAQWVGETEYSLGTLIQDGGLVYKCTTAGISDSVEPSWPTTGIGTTVVDGTCIWTLYAAHHPITEIKLATDSGDLAAATPGGSLSIGPEVEGGAANHIELHIRITNTVTTVSNNTGNEEIGLYPNALIELGEL